MKLIKILLVDDNILIRRSIGKVLSSIPQVVLAGECSDGSEVMPFLENNKVDVVFMDIIMRVMDGFETTKLIKLVYPNVKIIAFSSMDHLLFINKMRSCGADGFVSKFDASPKVIIDGLEEVGVVFD